MLEVSKRLSQAILSSELSYAELEKRTNIAKSSIQRYATGVTKKIPIDAVKLIADATNTSAAWIMGWSEKIEKKNDAIADIVIRLRTDSNYMEVVQSLQDLTSEQLMAVKTLLSTFK
jgi:transcriptional regulator with XRE-family HTH domain